MKTTKRALSLLLALTLLLALFPVLRMTSAEAAGNVTINAQNFPDSNFRSYVSEFDTDGNGVLSTSELNEVDTLFCTEMNISNLKGVEYFTSLTELYCGDNRLTSLDLRSNTKLEYLDCNCNSLTSLNVSGLTKLGYLCCYDNQLTSLNVTTNTALDSIFCSNNRLTSLDVSKNTKLMLLSIQENQLKELSIRSNPRLTVLFCQDNKISRLDIRSNPILEATVRYGTSEMDNTYVTYERELQDGYETKSKLAFDKKTGLLFSDGTVFGVNPFDDVTTDNYFYNPVMWAFFHDPQITGGVSATLFGPGKTCTREQIVTFLWKACGAPAPVTTSNPFSDVDSSKYYYKAVLWAVENKITGGAGGGKFGVGKPCTRAQAMTFLWKACGSPAPTSSYNPFTDVIPGKYYEQAILWAVEKGITKGVSSTKFGVDKTCTRGQIVTFLYKALGNG